MVLFISSFLFAQTHIPSGDVSGNWTIEDSPYIVDGHITVPMDSTLTIDAGVNVVFSGHYYMEIDGQLLAEGTINDTIKFTAQDTTVGWLSIHFIDTNINEQETSRIEYCKVEYGKAVYGGGIYCDSSSPNIFNTLIANNEVSDYGGGISCVNSSSPTLINVTIKNNTAQAYSGIYCKNNSNIILQNVNIIDNYGTAFYAEESSSPTLENVLIKGNQGGGFICHTAENVILNNVLIRDNRSGITILGVANTRITNTSILGNRERGINLGGCPDAVLKNIILRCNGGASAGGLNVFDSDVYVINALISHNRGEYTGGIYSSGSHINLTNVTVTRNIPMGVIRVGGMFCENQSDIIIRNSIIWNNTDGELFLYGENTHNLSYSDIGEWEWEGVGIIDANPLFTDSDFHLCEGSLCIDSGDPDSLYSDIEDPNNPTYALYPAMGTIRNDMGYYGGHGAYNPYASESNDELQITNYELDNYPNPFNPSTTISYQLPKNVKDAKIEIYNLKGQFVRKLDVKSEKSGIGKVIWDGRNDNGEFVGSGVYFYKLNVNGKTIAAKKCLMLK